MNRDDQLMSEPNRVIDDKIDFDAKIDKLTEVGIDLSQAVGVDYHDPTTIENFSIDSINEFGQVISSSLPEPIEERRGDYVSVKALFKDIDGEQDLRIVCSGKAWYVVPPGIDINYVLLAAKEIEEIQNSKQE